MNPGLFLVLMSLVLVMIRFRQPWVSRPTGMTLGTLRVPVRARVRLQRANVYAVAALLLLGGAGGWLPPLAQFAVIGLVFVALVLPLDYTLTDHGIALGRSPMRAWREFECVIAESGRIVLSSVDGTAMDVWHSGSSDAASLVAEIGRLVRGDIAIGDVARRHPGSKGNSRKRVSPRVV
jgi:hypothetical protein